MSCLPSNALSHFEQREQELLALNQALDAKRAHAVSEASLAVTSASAASQQLRPLRSTLEPGAAAGPCDVDAVSTPRGTRTASPRSSPRAASPKPSLPPLLPAADNTFAESLMTTVRMKDARISSLQEELSRTADEVTSRSVEVERLKVELKRAVEENKRLQKVEASSDHSREKSGKQTAELEAKVRDLEAQNAELLRERDQLEVQRRKTTSDINTKDARINRLSEEVEKHKGALKESKSQDKDRGNADRKETERLTVEVKKLERQRSELVAAFKKQMKLIDVLKRQRAHIEAAMVLQFTEEEFIRILELGDKLGQ
mmetsp:Transcript_36828/g.98054  ORF Transcript_36828/g.98054 Transcript_36828/m.98054 type:complete len:316 (-) Transcript_36828:237-1184(-)